MKYTSHYKLLIEREVRIARLNIEPMNVYRISQYTTTSGSAKPLSGDRSSLVFVVGLHPHPQKDKLINCLKLNDLPVDKFFKWLRTIKGNTVGVDLSEWLIGSDKSGKRLFEQYIKPSKLVYNLDKSIYRTYDLTGVTHARKVIFKQDVLTENLL
jgi:hypothetical protein